MNTDARRLRLGLPLLVGLVAIVAAFAGSASISDRSAGTRVAPVDVEALTEATDDPLAQPSAVRRAAEGASLTVLAGSAVVRKKVRCDGCGVVESVTRIDRREIVGGVCSFAYSDRFWITGSARDGGAYAGVATLADSLDGVLAGRPGVRSLKVASRYQFVIRLPDGTRRVFDEATARGLHSGVRVRVIAGANLVMQ
jgi:hypothetical protein